MINHTVAPKLQMLESPPVLETITVELVKKWLR